MTPSAVSFALRVVADAPLTPSSDDARRLLEEELSKGVYHQRENLFTQIWNWLVDWWNSIPETVSSTGPGAIVAILLAIALIIIVVVLVVRRSSKVSLTLRGNDSAVLTADDRRTAKELRADAETLAKRGDIGFAIVERFRAIARELEERAVLDDRPGRTAHEVVDAASGSFPAETHALLAAAAAFDRARYGDEPASVTDYAVVADVDERIHRSKPIHTAGVAHE